MNNQQALKVEKAIEKFFFKVRYNITLHKVLESNEYQDFEKEVEAALKKQIVYFAKVQTINRVVLLNKADDDADYASRVEEEWQPIDKFISPQDVLFFLVMAAAGSERTIMNTIPFEPTELSDANRVSFEKKLQTRAEKVLGDIDTTTRDWIVRTINKGVNRGDSHYDIARDIYKVADAVSDYRAATIAEQEAAWAVGALTVDIYRKNKIQYVRLVTSRDERVCEECDGDESVGAIKLGDAFPSGATTTPIHVNCRCFILPVM